MSSREHTPHSPHNHIYHISYKSYIYHISHAYKHMGCHGNPPRSYTMCHGNPHMVTITATGTPRGLYYQIQIMQNKRTGMPWKPSRVLYHVPWEPPHGHNPLPREPPGVFHASITRQLTYYVPHNELAYHKTRNGPTLV